MKTYLRILAGLVCLGVIVLLAIIFVPPQLTKPTEPLSADWKPAPGQGEYAMRMADCAACHTAEGGKPFAGGRAIDSPMGTIWSTNITPDKETGIGGWSLDDFRAALVDGIAPGGEHLYPAMPYENYRHLSETDIRAIYDYFMNDVPAVNNKVQETALAFPFNQRWGIRLWNWVALGSSGFKPETDAIASDEQLARGAYLVQGPGHCASCHSPRNMIMAEGGKTSQDASFLSGGVIGGWEAPDLRSADAAAQRWSAKDLKAYLTTGRNAHTAVAGEMALAVKDSLQYMTDEDADAMVAYLHHIIKGDRKPAPSVPDQSLSAPRQIDNATDATSLKLAKGIDLDEGEMLYMDNCAACHLTNGKGAAGVFPAMSDNSLVTSDQTTGLIQTILYGAEMPSTVKRPEKLKMPGFAERLSDKDVAALATFLRKGWGNDAGAVSADAVKAVRH
nr:cytochrome c [uncultured Cohaesibacter sp.]